MLIYVVGAGFTMTSSKGNCAIVNSALSCASTITTPTIFSVRPPHPNLSDKDALTGAERERNACGWW